MTENAIPRSGKTSVDDHRTARYFLDDRGHAAKMVEIRMAEINLFKSSNASISKERNDDALAHVHPAETSGVIEERFAVRQLDDRRRTGADR